MGEGTRRELLAGGGALALAAAMPVRAADASLGLPRHMAPIPLRDVRLAPSPFLDAVEANRRYLLSLDADRLLHNFRTGAGLAPKGAVYGGWESDTIAGHTLGHYLSALALIHAQTGDAAACRRAAYIVDELAAVQARHRDGYVAGFTRKRSDGTIVDGKEIFPEIIRGEIRSAGFDLNGCWVPLYNVHKLLAGLLDVQHFCSNGAALPVAVGLAGYIATVVDALDDDQVQTMLACEHGGINESFAELHARTGNPRWLRMGERLYHRKVLDPLGARHDDLANIHANTQVPKLIGLARLHEVGGRADLAVAPRFFWERVTGHHSYVIGGNADREYFFAPDAIAQHITEQTCEHCNSYNMLKLTRHLFGWQPDGALFDYYERTHFNHILAAQDPKTGMFTYMTPLMAGTKRDFSTPIGDFWCCVGSGMESHAKHGDSIYWQGDDMLLVNLFIPSRATWAARRATVVLETGYPHDGRVDVTLAEVGRPGRFAVALRVPAWAGAAGIAVNGVAVAAERASGYAIVRRRWRAGDRVTIDLPMALRIEAAPGDPDMIAILRGPLVLAADLGPAGAPYDQAAAPALVGDAILRGFRPVEGTAATYRTVGLGRPADMRFAPFFAQYDRRSAVYFKRFTDAGWAREKVAFAAGQARQAELARRSVDVMHLGEMQAERDHALTSDISYPVVYRGRNGRDARTGGFFAFRAKVRPGPLILQASYWGDERNRVFDILVDGVVIATQRLEAPRPGDFVDIDYPVPAAVTKGKTSVLVRFQPRDGKTAGPVFGVRLFTAPAADASTV